MNKDEMKMIEEMAKVLCDKNCEECSSILLVHCGYKSYCTKLYNAGCRIIGDDKMVLDKNGYYEHINAVQESGKRMGYAQGREETAREILRHFPNNNARKFFANKYGIEIELE